MLRKRKPITNMIKTWLGTNRHGRLTSDQWLNLVTAPILTLIFLSVPVTLLFIATPARLLLAFRGYGRWVLPIFLGALVIMLVLRARRYARLPVYQGIFYSDERETSLGGMFQQNLRLFTEKGEPITFQRFAGPKPALEPDTPYMVYFLVEEDQRTLLSYAPTAHPDVERWEPSEKFYERQKGRNVRA